MPKTKKEKPSKKKKKTKKKRRGGFFKWLSMAAFSIFITILLIGFIGILAIYYTFTDELPDVRALKSFEPSTVTLMYSDQDQLIAELYLEKRILVPLNKIPIQLKQAALAVEDANFYRHMGIDLKAIFRAFLTNLKAGRVVEGGSTITQQLSKTLFLSRERSLVRKIKEAILSVRMELIFTKDEILEMYLNQIYYGHGSYGVEAAARTYFGKNVKNLSLDEVALIAGLPKSPNNYSPYRNPKRARSRRNHVIRRMAQEGFVKSNEAKQAMKKPFTLGEVTNMLNRAPYFVEYIRKQLMTMYGRNKVYKSGLKVYTTLNIEKQILAQEATKKNLRIADKRYGYRGPLGTMDISLPEIVLQESLYGINNFTEGVLPEKGIIIKGLVKSVNKEYLTVLIGQGEGIIELKDMDWAREPNIKVDGRWARIHRVDKILYPGDKILVKVLGVHESGSLWSLSLEQEPEVESALISIEPHNGHIKALIGGYDFSKSQFNRAIQAVRQPGSVFKPIVYATAFSKGYSPASIIIDSPIIFKEKDHAFDKWKPVNFEKKFYGPTPLRKALAHSRNIVTVKLLQKIGTRSVIQMAKNLGIKSRLENNLSIGLGSSGITLQELVSAYSSFANSGIRVEPQSIRYVENRNGKILYKNNQKQTQPITSGVAQMITSLLQSVVQEGTAKKVRSLNRPTAGKTGTTNNYIDAWFMGFTPKLITGVWVGKDNVEPLGRNETGSRTAIPIWLDYMKGALLNEPIHNFPVSPETIYAKINPQTRSIAKHADSKGFFEIFLKDKLPNSQDHLKEVMTDTTF
ncbi:MAG TPA: PBP1A family penicillin-binding protein [Nitrospinaceae bacterium]|nr:PBP1A family penicillin-binding protein [Nitrospinaceae bacterium]